MSWDVAMFGSLSVPEANLEAWLTTPVSPDEFPWLEDLPGNDVLADTPEALLLFLSDVTTAPHELFSVVHRAARVEVGCFVADDPYRETCQALAMLFASASSFGGSGSLVFFGYQGIRFGERLVVNAAGVALTQLSSRELEAVEHMPAFRALDARIHERFDSLVGRPPLGAGQRGAVWSIHPFTGRRVRMAATARSAHSNAIETPAEAT
jgi:hypothetical protein